MLEWVAFPFSREFPSLEIELGSPGLLADSLPTELSGKPRNHIKFSLAFVTFSFAIVYSPFVSAVSSSSPIVTVYTQSSVAISLSLNLNSH